MKLPDITSHPAVRYLVRRALAEDVGSGDATTRALIPESARTSAVILTREDCTVAGGTVAALCFRLVDRRIRTKVCVHDGARARRGAALLEINGPARGILTAERTALNLMQRLSGIATLTDRFVRVARRYGVAVLDTRKTSPMQRVLEKYAVLCGGGRNHRMGLYDMILIKDNHRRFWSGSGKAGLGAAVETARRAYSRLKIEIEVENEKELRDALTESPDWILLDNMPPAQLKRCVAIAKGRCKLEASGGVTLQTIGSIARTRVDAVSIGALTHSAPAIDLSLEIN